MAGGSRRLRMAGAINATVIVLTLLVFWLLFPQVAPPLGIADPGARMAFWGRLAFWPALLLASMVLGVMVARGRSVALNPIDDPESRLYRISQRVLSNSVEQTLVFLPALAAFVALAPLPDLGAARLAVWLFAAGRVLFWIGYLVHPYVRAPGMAVTLTVNLTLLVWALTLVL